MSAVVQEVPPAQLAGRLLFEPIAGLLARFPGACLPSAAALSALLGEVAPEAVNGAGEGIRFTLPPADLHAYEAHIHATGAVPTRPDDWHDFFNALAWCVWPRSKAACNGLHLQQLAQRQLEGLSGRGPLRDALTQFDECGIVVVSADPAIPALLMEHRWEEALWTRRQQLIESTRFLVFGHGSWDSLRAPFFGLCAKALYRVVDADWLNLSETARQRDTDAWLAAHLASGQFSKAELHPLPLLGIPGVSAANNCAEYYRDPRQFRPSRVRGRNTAEAGL